jgi:hypothetical protein
MTAPSHATPWHALLPPVTAKVDCAGSSHELRWADGRLQAASHPDAESELVLAALGGDQPECIRLVQAWGAHSDDLDVFAIGPRSADDELTLPPEEFFPGPGGWLGRSATLVAHSSAMSVTSISSRSGSGAGRSRRTVGRISAGHPGRATRDDLLDLFGLGPEFAFRLIGTVAASWTDREPNAARPALIAALTGRLAPAAAAWLGTDPERVRADPHDGPGWGTLAAQDGELHARLPVGWLASVWAPGLSVVDGRLVVGVTEAAWPTAQVLAVRRPGDDPTPLSVTRRSQFRRNPRWST